MSKQLISVSSVDEFLFGNDLIDDPVQHSYYDESDHILHLFKWQKEPFHPSCPYCRMPACRTCGWENRTCQLLSVSGITVFLHLRQRRFKCENPACSHRTFTVETPGFKPFQHRSNQLNIVIFALSLFFSWILRNSKSTQSVKISPLETAEKSTCSAGQVHYDLKTSSSNSYKSW